MPTYYSKRISNYKSELETQYSNSHVSNKISYKLDCEKDANTNKIFPQDSPNHAILYNCCITGAKQKLTNDQLEAVLVILNDSTSYEWGEIATPDTEYYIVFYNKHKKCIGITEIDLSGQTYSSPYRSLMKQGFINQITFPRLKRILKIK